MRIGAAVSVVLGALAVLYVADLLAGHGEVPRGVTVAGVAIGGLKNEAAEQRLRDELGPRLASPVVVEAGEAQATLDPAAVDLRVDWRSTIDDAMEQPLNPWTRLTSLFDDRTVTPSIDASREAVAAALGELRQAVERPVREGAIAFDGSRPVVTEPQPGLTLNVNAALDTILEQWPATASIRVTVDTVPTATTTEGVRRALADIAEPAVSSPLTVNGDGASATLSPEQIAAAVSFAVDQRGGLSLAIDEAVLISALRPQLAGTEQPGTDARVLIRDNRPVVEPSRPGRGVDFEKILTVLPDVLRQTTNRVIDAEYGPAQPSLTTEQATGLGIKEIIGVFTTGGFANDSGVNIRRVAEEVDGALVLPGATFSLNGHTGPRGEQDGYVPAGVIEDGTPDRAIGGGISQFATTLYNASYLAGMVDVEHREHSYHISRYPLGREATVFEGSIDLKFRNDGPSGVLIQTIWDPASITVRLWGTKRYEVTSETGPRTDITAAGTQSGSSDTECVPSAPTDGFTVTDTRILRDLTTGEIRRETRTVIYEPKPRIVC